MGTFYKGQRVRIVAGSYKTFGTGTYIEECGKVSCRVKIDHDIASERTIREASIRAFPPAKSSFRKSSVNGDSSEDAYEGSGQWSPTRTKLYRQKAEQAERATKKKKKEAILRELKSLKATMLERIKAVEKEIMDLKLDD
jgi:hypothetical protein